MLKEALYGARSFLEIFLVEEYPVEVRVKI
jgi:hypothetical protein